MTAPTPARLLRARQVEVLTLVANGQSNASAAVAMRVSERAVETALTRIGRRLGTTGRAHTVAVAIRLGLIALEDIHLPDALKETA